MRTRLWLVDNNALQTLPPCRVEGFERVELLRGHGNIGYGAGHNLALAADRVRCAEISPESAVFQLILNSDVEIAEDALLNALRFLHAHPQAGLLAPAVIDTEGRLQYLCKRYPSVLDLFLRGFAPRWLRRRLDARLARYEMRDRLRADGPPVWDVPIVSGCFMLIRRELLERLEGFSPRYFLYFEDFDLSLRLSAYSRSVYLPSARIVHYGGGAADKGLQHIGFFIRSGLSFFNRHGWKWV